MAPENQDPSDTVSKVCPECGITLEGKNPKAHALSHWPAHIDPHNPKNAEAIKRQKFLMEGS
jgi:hypothetical protein